MTEENINHETPTKCKFRRIEKKFFMTEEQYLSVLPLFNEYMDMDIHGKSTVFNLYYDTYDYILIRKSMERPKFKEKLRLRCYGIPSDNSDVFIELKKKYNGIGYKRRIMVPFRTAQLILSGQEVPCEDMQTEREILEFLKTYNPSPKIAIEYERYAMYGRDNADLRITIDTDIRYFKFDGYYSLDKKGISFTDPSKPYLMEIKTSGAIPQWLLGKMSEKGIYQAPFSKIGTCFSNCFADNISSEILKVEE